MCFVVICVHVSFDFEFVQLLEAMVERPPPRSIHEFGMDGLGTLDTDLDDAPVSPAVGSPTSQVIGFAGVNGLGGPPEQGARLPPRPYVSRRASTLTTTTTSSSGKGISPCVGADADASSTDPGSSAF